MDRNRRLIVISVLVVLGIIALGVLISATRTLRISNTVDDTYEAVCPEQLIDPDTGECMPWNTTEEECEWARVNGHLEYYRSTGRCL